MVAIYISADNLVGRGEATEEFISFRTSGGNTSIEDGVARIERLKGNSVVWNQLAEQPHIEFVPTTHDYYRAHRSTGLSKVDINHQY